MYVIAFFSGMHIVQHISLAQSGVFKFSSISYWEDVHFLSFPCLYVLLQSHLLSVGIVYLKIGEQVTPDCLWCPLTSTAYSISFIYRQEIIDLLFEIGENCFRSTGHPTEAKSKVLVNLSQQHLIQGSMFFHVKPLRHFSVSYNTAFLVLAGRVPVYFF